MKISAMIFLYILILFFANPVTSKLVMMADSFEMCDKTPNFPGNVTNMQIRLSKEVGTYIVGEVHVLRDIPNQDFKVSVQVLRCASKEVLDSCEFFINLKPLMNSCAFLNAKHTAWNKFVRGFEPPFQCPMTKGVRIAKHVTMEGGLLNMFPLTQWYWIIKIILGARNETYTVCLNTRFVNRN